MEELLGRLDAHLGELDSNPSKPIDTELLEEVRQHSASSELKQQQRLGLIARISPLLSKLQQDPTSLAETTASLLESAERPTFLQIVTLEPEVELVAGLKAPSESINRLILHLLAGAQTSADVGFLAGKSDVVSSLVELWLTTTRTGIAEKAEQVLTALLGAESPVEEDGLRGSVESFPTHEAVFPASSGLMWRRIFKDKAIYGFIFSTCSLANAGSSGQLEKSRKTIAQARLLALLKKILYAPQLWESQVTSVEASFGVKSGAGILDFALRLMVDWKDDVLMHITLIDFFSAFIAYRSPHDAQFANMAVPVIDGTSHNPLEIMQQSGLHERTMSYFLAPDAGDLFSEWLYGPTATYIAAYARTYTSHFIEHAATAVLRKASTALQSTPPSAWANARAPSHDIQLLAHLPRNVILRCDGGGIVSLLPTHPANADALQALAVLLGGPASGAATEAVPHTGLDAPPKASPYATDAMEETDEVAAERAAERAAARALFFLYTAQHPTFWKDVTTAADQAATEVTAHAALALVYAIVTSDWAPMPSAATTGSALPSEAALRARCPGLAHPLPPSGALAMASEPALGTVLPWLISSPPPRPSVAGATDPAAYSLALTKHALLPELRAHLTAAAARGRARAESQDAGIAWDEPPAWREMLELLERRERMGPLGVDGGRPMRVPQPEVGTMEM